MNSLKTLVIVIVLIGLAYLVSKKIMLGPEDGSSEDWGSFSEEFSFQGTSAPEEFAGPESPPQMDLAMGDEPSSIWNSPTTPIEAAAPPPADSFVGSAMPAQPDASATITRTLFVGLAMIESLSIYCFVVSMILIFANPFWNTATV